MSTEPSKAQEKIIAQVKQEIDIPWELLSRIKVLDKLNTDEVWEVAISLIPELKASIVNLNLQFVSNAVGFDSVLLNAGTHISKGTRFSFFHDEPGLNEKTATEKQEAELAAWLLDKRIVKQWLTAYSALPEDSCHLTGVTTPILTGNEEVGDIDALVVAANNRSKAVAVECKRIKAVVTNGVATINGIDNIKKGVRQANALRSLGFFKTWLAVIVIVDGRGETEANLMFRGLPQSDFSNIFKKTYEYALCGKRKLHDDVGIVFFEIVQTKDRPIDDASFISMCVCRDAKAIEQPDALSERVKALIDLSK